MLAARKELQESLCCYTADTLIYIDTVREFCERNPKWMLGRETELEMMRDIKDRADNIDLSIGHVTQSKNKGKAFWEYMKSKVTSVTPDSKRAELEKELAGVLKDTLRGLEKLNCFLDALENLAVTSLHVLIDENQVLRLPEGISPEHVQVVITAARVICPLLLEFKRDASVFFLPKLQNVKGLAHQLDKYIKTTQKLCEKLEKNSFSDFCQEMNDESLVDLEVDLSEDDIQRMLHHINQLEEIRMNQSFHTWFLFHDKPCSGFIDMFSERQPRMLQFLKDLEENAVQLDRMNTGAASAFKVLKNQELIASAGKVSVQEVKALRNVPRVEADIPDIGQAAVKGPLALSKSARAGFIGLNALFLGMDIYFICKDSINLAKGSRSEVSQFIRARTALRRSEMDSWQKIHDFLCEGRLTSEENKAILETPFYPEKEMKKEKEKWKCFW
ncbi:uncharacterized protein LOC117957610 [Etheostoma cragini]|uniref:uncharacterized protein LOC117957610 n=1 Tax=Etheostoma cragini TaxID=417921 RepID=UPI00155DE566|nr:uncharacterized protein LOC117957610 [Etheostoma cragini]